MQAQRRPGQGRSPINQQELAVAEPATHLRAAHPQGIHVQRQVHQAAVQHGGGDQAPPLPVTHHGAGRTGAPAEQVGRDRLHRAQAVHQVGDPHPRVQRHHRVQGPEAGCLLAQALLKRVLRQRFLPGRLPRGLGLPLGMAAKRPPHRVHRLCPLGLAQGLQAQAALEPAADQRPGRRQPGGAGTQHQADRFVALHHVVLNVGDVGPGHGMTAQELAAHPLRPDAEHRPPAQQRLEQQQAHADEKQRKAPQRRRRVVGCRRPPGQEQPQHQNGPHQPGRAATPARAKHKAAVGQAFWHSRPLLCGVGVQAPDSRSPLLGGATPRWR
jgi:hypothetical protein